MSFKKWLMQQSWRKDLVGDLACAVTEDNEWPNSEKLPVMHQHLSRMTDRPEAFKALTLAWAEYIDFLIPYA